MLITLHMFSLSVVCTLNTQLKLLPFKRCTVLRQTVNGNFNLTPTVCIQSTSLLKDRYFRSSTGECALFLVYNVGAPKCELTVSNRP